MKHTPAPWIVELRYENGMGWPTYRLSINHPYDSRGEEAMANAVLIAAAPEMYELLKELRQTVNLHAEEMIDKVLIKIDGEVTK